jgi:glycosyltransferase involved in cell wall biosynthesis
MGEHARSVFKALRAAGASARLVDIYGPEPGADRQLVNSYDEYLSRTLGHGINIFCINADEVAQAFSVMQHRNLRAAGSCNIIYPAWELSRFPDEWGRVLDAFDEVWAPSRFIADAVQPATRSPVLHMPLACEIGERALLSRRHFGLPDNAYCFLFAFDFLSYVERKNPYAVLSAFEQVIEQRPAADVRLVIKLNNTHRKPEDFSRFKEFFYHYKDRVVLINGTLTDLEMKALVWLCDCFVSLHRSEGFGRGISEAMTLGKPTLATAYSGNLDFCNDDTCFLVTCEMVPVGPGEYPHWQNQVWAAADTTEAAQAMVALIDDPALGWRKGSAARNNMKVHFSFLARGLAYARRCDELKAG